MQSAMSWSEPALRILIVCSANRFRSPLAEYLMRREWAGYMIDIESAGMHAQEGAPAHAAARAIAAAHGLTDIEAHRTRRLTPALLTNADLILTMDEQQQRAVMRAMPTYSGRVLLLGCWRGVTIDEPIVTSESSREWTFGLLRECVDDWKRRLSFTLRSLIKSTHLDQHSRVH
jgi:protein-tyrosine phosphatase